MADFNNDNFKDINSILNNALKPDSLKDLFDKKVYELAIAPTNVLGILDISHRSLKGILDGTQKTVDFTNLVKLSNFLQLPKEYVIKLYVESLEKNFPVNDATSPQKIKFIKENFDLAILKKDKFIDNLTDFSDIEKRIVSRLGLKSIFEYKKPVMDIAFSSGRFKSKSEATRAFWITAAKACFQEIDNPYEYDRTALLEYFPLIRWHSTDVIHGLTNVIKKLYKLGVTVIYQPPLHTLQLRGSTFPFNGKPCIVLTNYVGFYGTMWFALIHELLHVIFDWNEIKENKYHFTDDSNEELSVKEKEDETNKFAREYLFSVDKTNQIRPFLNDITYVKKFAEDNHVHPSIIYTLNARDTGNKDRMAWARARRQDAPIKDSLSAIDIPWSEKTPFDKFMSNRKFEIYN